MLYWVFTISERDDKTEVLVKKFGRNKGRAKKWIKDNDIILPKLHGDPTITEPMYPHGLFIKEIEQNIKKANEDKETSDSGPMCYIDDGCPDEYP